MTRKNTSQQRQLLANSALKIWYRFVEFSGETYFLLDIFRKYLFNVLDSKSYSPVQPAATEQSKPMCDLRQILPLMNTLDPAQMNYSQESYNQDRLTDSVRQTHRSLVK